MNKLAATVLQDFDKRNYISREDHDKKIKEKDQVINEQDYQIKTLKAKLTAKELG